MRLADWTEDQALRSTQTDLRSVILDALRKQQVHDFQPTVVMYAALDAHNIDNIGHFLLLRGHPFHMPQAERSLYDSTVRRLNIAVTFNVQCRAASGGLPQDVHLIGMGVMVEPLGEVLDMGAFGSGIAETTQAGKPQVYFLQDWTTHLHGAPAGSRARYGTHTIMPTSLASNTTTPTTTHPAHAASASGGHAK